MWPFSIHGHETQHHNFNMHSSSPHLIWDTNWVIFRMPPASNLQSLIYNLDYNANNSSPWHRNLITVEIKQEWLLCQDLVNICIINVKLMKNENNKQHWSQLVNNVMVDLHWQAYCFGIAIKCLILDIFGHKNKT